jgi:TPR repeat protein
VTKQAEVAVFWYRAAANQGYVPAMLALAEALRTGTGVVRDQAEALEWQTKAAEASKP